MTREPSRGVEGARYAEEIKERGGMGVGWVEERGGLARGVGGGAWLDLPWNNHGTTMEQLWNNSWNNPWNNHHSLENAHSSVVE